MRPPEDREFESVPVEFSALPMIDARPLPTTELPDPDPTTLPRANTMEEDLHVRTLCTRLLSVHRVLKRTIFSTCQHFSS